MGGKAMTTGDSRGEQPLSEMATSGQPPRTETAPEEWVDLYADSLFRYAMYRVANPAIAEELVQETFLAALAERSKDRFHGQSSVKSWLIGILKHKITDHLRSKYRNRAEQLANIRENEIEEYFDQRGNWRVKPGQWGDDPQNRYEQSELLEKIIQCIDVLGQRQADVFRLREMDGYSAKEICQLLNVSTSNYWVLIHRARLALRRCLEQHWLTDSLVAAG
jgi:RNA polymerase sigma-70 factor, ECF subfamily